MKRRGGFTLLEMTIMIGIGIVVFIKGLGMPIPIWPTKVPDWLAPVLDLARPR